MSLHQAHAPWHWSTAVTDMYRRFASTAGLLMRCWHINVQVRNWGQTGEASQFIPQPQLPATKYPSDLWLQWNRMTPVPVLFTRVLAAGPYSSSGQPTFSSCVSCACWTSSCVSSSFSCLKSHTCTANHYKVFTPTEMSLPEITQRSHLDRSSHTHRNTTTAWNESQFLRKSSNSQACHLKSHTADPYNCHHSQKSDT